MSIKFDSGELKRLCGPGVYIIRRDGKVLYVGMSKAGAQRFFSANHTMQLHISSGETNLEFIETTTAEEASELETKLIQELQPVYNIAKTGSIPYGTRQKNQKQAKRESERVKHLVQETKQPRRSSDGLINKYFHSYPNDELNWQGQVLKEVSPGIFLVQFFSWLMGAPTDQKLIPLTQMIKDGWKFYDDDEEWRHEAEEYNFRHQRKEALVESTIQ